MKTLSYKLNKLAHARVEPAPTATSANDTLTFVHANKTNGVARSTMGQLSA
jgi:hypothetical protein